MIRFVCLLIGYVFGLFQTGFLVGKYHHMDIRQHGSGNAGTTNALRTMGRKAGLITLIGDMLKCVAAVALVRAVFGNEYSHMLQLLSIYTAAGCILGHDFPFYLKFRGGKGVAASLGLMLALDWRLFVAGLAVFLVILFTTHYVSLGSLIAYTGCLITLIVLGEMGMYGMSRAHTVEMYGIMIAMTVLVYVQHRANIVRLIHGNEKKIYLGKKYKRED